MELKWMLLFLLSLTGQQLSQATDECPEMEDSIEAMTLVETATEKQEIRQTQFMSRDEDPADDLVKDMSMERIRSAFSNIPSTLRDGGDEKKAGLAVAQDLWYLMRPYRWYWRFWASEHGTAKIQYCFSYWWVWATYCPRSPCHNNYYPFQQWWDPRFQCFPEYRIMWLPMVCYESPVKSGRPQKGKWLPWTFRKVYVPRGCCCRKYWYWLSVSAGKCSAVTTAAPA